MQRPFLMMTALVAVTACGDPLDRVEKLSDVSLAPQDIVRDVAASPEELARKEGGFLGGLFRRAEPTPQDDPVSAAVSSANASLSSAPLHDETPVAAEEDPLEEAALPAAEQANETSLAEAEVIDDNTIAQPKRRGGVLGLFRRATEAETLAANTTETTGLTETATTDQSVASVEEPLAAEVIADAAPNSETPEILTPQADAQVDAVQTEPTKAEPAPKRGLFKRLAGQKRSQDASENSVDDGETVEPVLIVAEAPSDIKTNAPEAKANVETLASSEEPAPGVQVEAVKRQGLLGGLFGNKQDAQDVTVRRSPEPTVEVEDVKVASLTPEETTQEPPSKRRAARFNSRGDAPRKGPDKVDVSFGDVLPFGTIARVCDAKNEPLGRKLEKAGSGKGYALFDSNAGSTAPRTFYVTGFSDGCPRQFTAALALFGEPAMHEQLRYGRPSEKYPYSTTDKAYEKVKSAICKVSRREPCGSKISTLEKNTVFISTYERFTDNGRWADILVHDGTVLAAALKDP
ncbi:MAG: hypothetical protein ABJL99_24665 [Aliishimia sp.]